MADIPSTIIVLLVMIAAAALVCCGYAVHSFAVGFTGVNGFKPLSSEQADYMREVRSRNLDALQAEGYHYMRGSAR
jgi:hypothetical protein